MHCSRVELIAICRGATIFGSAVGGFNGVAQLSALANGTHNHSVDFAYAGAVTGGVMGALGVLNHTFTC